MMKKTLDAFALVVLLICCSALAHDPGLSNLRIVVAESEINLTLHLSAHDLQTVLSDAGSETEESEDLRALARELIGTRLISVRRVAEADGDRKIICRYSAPSGAWPLAVEVPFLQRLARGHRMYAVVVDARGRQIGEALLHAGNNRLMLTRPAPKAAP
ncbi:MAG TPA: hypothetical protein VLU25_20435 [Acidobacteriota bacterium]|nr:hypothetical protein [Acidobacteriota bacterium]